MEYELYENYEETSIKIMKSGDVCAFDLLQFFRNQQTTSVGECSDMINKLDGINMHRMIVVFHKYGWCIKFKDQGMEYIEPITDDFIENFEPYSIGNIYENPNLIKEVL